MIVIYVHEQVGSMRRGALRVMKDWYLAAGQERQANLLKIHVVNPTKYLQARMFLAERSSKEARVVFEKIYQHKRLVDFVNYLQVNEADQSIALKFVKQLPETMLASY